MNLNNNYNTRYGNRNPLVDIAAQYIVDSPVPSNISYQWNFGSLLGLTLGIQIISGISLSFHYQPNIEMAFESVESIMRNENLGYIIRYLHSNGAGLFFIIVYLHINRNIYYGSYNKPRTLLWLAGVLIFLVMMGTAFIGYVLVWGNMSLWGAIVITNLLSVIPFIGNDVVQFIWGGFSVSNPTLTRFYGLHFTLPFIIAALVIIHLISLHQYGSNNPLGISSVADKITFHPYFTYKDLITFIILFISIISFIGYLPNILGHPDNYIEANPLVTPAHIVPEFYFLPFYAILRSIPDKTIGVVCFALSVGLLLILPFISTSSLRSLKVKSMDDKYNYYQLLCSFILLLLIGGLSVEYPYVEIGSIASNFYFYNLFGYTLYRGYIDRIMFYESVPIKSSKGGSI